MSSGALGGAGAGGGASGGASGGGGGGIQTKPYDFGSKAALEGAYAALDKSKEGPPEEVQADQNQMEAIYGTVKSSIEAAVSEGHDPFTEEGFNLILNSVVGGDEISVEQSNELLASLIGRIPAEGTTEQQKEMLIVGLTETLITADEDGDAQIEAEDLNLPEAPTDDASETDESSSSDDSTDSSSDTSSSSSSSDSDDESVDTDTESDSPSSD